MKLTRNELLHLIQIINWYGKTGMWHKGNNWTYPAAIVRKLRVELDKVEKKEKSV